MVAGPEGEGEPDGVLDGDGVPPEGAGLGVPDDDGVPVAEADPDPDADVVGPGDDGASAGWDVEQAATAPAQARVTTRIRSFTSSG